MTLSYDIILDKDAFRRASEQMRALVVRTSNLQEELKALYEQLKGALDTPAGRQVEFTATKVLLQPISDLLAVVQHTSETLDMISGTGYYNDIFVKYDELNRSIK